MRARLEDRGTLPTRSTRRSRGCSRAARSTTAASPAPTRAPRSRSKDAAGSASRRELLPWASPRDRRRSARRGLRRARRARAHRQRHPEKLRGRPVAEGSARAGPALSIPHAAGFTPAGVATALRRSAPGGATIRTEHHHAFQRDPPQFPRILRSRTATPSCRAPRSCPADDPTLLFTNAGMNQFKDVFLGKEKRAYTRATTSQKCMRVSGKHNDLDNVGPSLRHHTFFEMLGNFSFGDYFKKEAIPFAWELLTEVWSCRPDRLYPPSSRARPASRATTRRYDDLDAVRAGRADHRARRGRELLADGRDRALRPLLGDPLLPRRRRALRRRAARRTCRGIECSCDRYVEIWNNVFMEFDRQADGTLNPLPAPSIDTGMGLERITAVIQGKLSNYDTDLFTPILDAIGDAAGRPYGATHRRSGRRVDARHRRPPARDDLPHRRRRRPVERMARLRAAQDHAARDAARQEARLHRAGPARRSWTCVVGEMGDAYPELRTEPRRRSSASCAARRSGSTRC